MMRGFKSFWWVHLPGIAAIVLMVALTAAKRPWPSRVPVHFDLHWNVDRWGSPWEFTAFPVLATLIVIAGMAASAMWADREEGRKRFNLTLPLMAAPLGAIAGAHFWYWWNIARLAVTGQAPHAWGWVWICAAIVAAATTALEMRRKPIPAESGPQPPTISAAATSVDRDGARMSNTLQPGSIP